MSRRGEIVVECDTPECHAELVLSAVQLEGHSIMRRMREAGWDMETDRCEQCIEEEGKRHD